MIETQSLSVDRYVLDSLMVDLVGHDRRPSAYILYLALLRLGGAHGEIGMSLQALATATGLSKTAVQRSVAHLVRRELMASRSISRNQAPHYWLLQPWRR